MAMRRTKSNSRRYDIFFSYTKRGRPELADRVYRRLGRIGRPWTRLSAFRIFRDTTTLPATERLWPTIASSIESSTNFLLVASPEAAESQWVEREITHYLRTRGSRPIEGRGRLLIALVEGSVAWSEADGDFDWDRTTALPRSLVRTFTNEPLFVDFTGFSGQGRRQGRQEFDTAVARLSAGFRGVSPDDILGADRTTRRRLRLATAVVLAIVAAIVMLSLRTWRHYQDVLDQRDEADHVIREREPEFERIRDLPIRSLEVAVRMATLPRDGSALEVRITHDRLISQPMHFFVEPFREDGGWPEQLDIPALPDVREFPCGGSELMSWFRWYDKDEPMTPVTPLAGDPWGYATMTFPGSEYDPPGALSLPQPFELPSFDELADHRASIELFLHGPSSDVARPLEADETDVEVEVSARFDEPTVSSFTFFRSHHTGDQREALGIDFLYSRPPLEKEALLTLYERAAPPRGATAVKPVRRRWQRAERPRSVDEKLQFQAFEMDAAITPGMSLVDAVRHYESAIRHGEGIADQLSRNPDSDPGRRALCSMTLARLNIAGLLKPTVPSRIEVLETSLARLESVPEPYRSSRQVRRWIVLTLLHIAQAWSARGEEPRAGESLRTAVSEAEAADDATSTVASAFELADWIQAADEIRSTLRADVANSLDWSPLVSRVCGRIDAALPEGTDAAARSEQEPPICQAG